MRHSEYSANLALASRAVARAAVPTPAELDRHALRTARRDWIDTLTDWGPCVVALVAFAGIGAALALAF